MRLLAPVTAVLAYFLAVAGLHPSATDFDGLSYLMKARAGALDYGHALYLPLLRAAQALSQATSGEAAPERVARLVSALGAALAFALLWRRMQRGGAPRLHAGLGAACFALSTLVWQEAGSIEPTTWTVAALLGAGEASAAYARRPTWTRLALSTLAYGAALGFHLVALFALPWLFACGSGTALARKREHILLPLLALALAGWLAHRGGELGDHLRYWHGFLPSYAGDPWGELARHSTRGGRLLLEGGAPLVVAALVAAGALGRAGSGRAREALWLGGPYLLAFLLLGKPLVGLLTPVLLSAALLLGEAGARFAARERPANRRTGLLLSLAAALQLLVSLPQALEWRRAPDAPRVRAERLARHVPEGALVFAGSLSNHLRYFHPALGVVSLPEIVHRARSLDRGADPVEVVRKAVAESGRRCVLSSDGAGFLLGLSADLTRLGLSLERAFLVPEDPSLALFPLSE
jgi:hypothetical protein